MKFVNKKDIKIISHYLGRVMQALGAAFLVPIIISILYLETNCIIGFAITSALSLIMGTSLNKAFKDTDNIRLKHAMGVSALAWLWASILGAIAMKLILNFPLINGLFENMSTWTGTGLTMFTNVEVLPKSIQFLRSFEGWLGGLGVVIIGIGVLIRSGTAAAKLYKSEARDERIKPSIVNTMQKTIEIYVIYTIFGVVLYLLAGLPPFDAINLCFAMICTGGMSIKNANIGFYNNEIIYIISMIIMILGSISFPVHYKVFKTKGKAILDDVQFKVIILLIVVCTTLIFFSCKILPTDALFMVISATTETGANCISSNQMMGWNSVGIIILLLLMFIGGSSGSTSGGIKVIRILTTIKGFEKTIMEILSPEGRIFKLKIQNKEITDRNVKESSSYIVIAATLILISWIILIANGYNGLDSLFDVISAWGNCGLSSGITGPDMPIIVKLTLTFDMWLGRLEIIPVLVMLRGTLELFKPSKKQRQFINNIISKVNPYSRKI